MRKILLFALLLLSPSLSLAAPTASEGLLRRVVDNLERLNPYGVEVVIDYGVGTVAGYYEVDNQSYYIAVDEQELYGDASVKYEVFNGRKEIIIDSVVDDQSGNLLNNPATAFSTILSHYSSSIIADSSESAIISLRPKAAGGDSVESIEITVDKLSELPTKITYKLGDDMIVIMVSRIERLGSTIKQYTEESYAGYEIIDFR